MREIIFRGKCKNNNEWVEGSLVSFLNYKSAAILVSKSTAFFPKKSTMFCTNSCYEVIPETVGQYTGLTDKSGKKIFEGDILRDDDSEENGIVVFSEGEYCVSFDNEFTYGFADIACSCYVNGNIHDNPELLKCGAEK